MLSKKNGPSNDINDLVSTLKSLHPICYADIHSTFYEKYNRTTDLEDFLSKINSAFKEKYEPKSNKKDYYDYEATAWISIWHCIQPFVVTVIVFFTIHYKRDRKGLGFSLPVIPDLPDCLEDSRVCRIGNYLGYLVYFLFRELGRLVPIPAFTNLYRFYLDVRHHIERSNPDFRSKMLDIEEQIREHEALGKL